MVAEAVGSCGGGGWLRGRWVVAGAVGGCGIQRLMFEIIGKFLIKKRISLSL